MDQPHLEMVNWKRTQLIGDQMKFFFFSYCLTGMPDTFDFIVVGAGSAGKFLRIF